MLPHSSAYVDAVLRGEAERVEHAALGTRNHTLFRAAARLGSFVAQGLVAEDVVIRCSSTPAATNRTSAAVRSRARSHPAFAAQPEPHPPLPSNRDWTRRQGRVGDRRVIHIRTSYPQTWCLQQRGGAPRPSKREVRIRLLIVGAVVLSCLTACAFDGPITVRTPGCMSAHGNAGSLATRSW